MAYIFDKASMNRDSATSSAVALIMILAVLAVCAGLWALLVIPEDVRMEEERRDEVSVSILSDITLMAEKLSDSTVYFALPAGTLHVRNCGEVYTDTGYSIPLTTLIYSPDGKSFFGILAGGVWRMDSRNAAWVLYPKISFDERILRISLPVYSGNAAYGSSKHIPFGIDFDESIRHSAHSCRLIVYADEEWTANLFEALFRETAFSYDDLDAEISRNGNRVTAEFSSETSDISLEIDEKRYRIYSGDTL